MMTDLFSDHRDAVVRALEHRFGRELAEDAVQDALTAAWASGEAPANPKAWLHVVAHRRAVDALRAQRETPHAEPPEAGAVCDPAEELLRRERVRSVLAAMRMLPGRQRDALLLRSLEDRSYAEIGECLAVEPENAKQLVSRGRRTLRRRLAGLVPAPLFARVSELAHRSFEVATGTAAGRACAGLCVAGAFASLGAQGPVVRQVAAAPTATPEATATPTATATATATPRRTPAPDPIGTPVATATSTPAPRRAAPAPTPAATAVPTPEAAAKVWDSRCADARRDCKAEFLRKSVADAEALKAERQAKVAARMPTIDAQSSDEERALWLRRQYASGECARTPEGIRACTEKLRAQPRAR